MKNTFTVKEIIDVTGLTRQRIHALIKSRKIQVTKENNLFLISWQDLLKMADNPTILGFLKSTLDSEKKQAEDGYQRLKENAKGLMYAYTLLIEKELPTPDGQDLDWIRQFRKAYCYWDKLNLELHEHWSLYQDKYWYLDQEKTD
jgi:hypothetical protein